MGMDLYRSKYTLVCSYFDVNSPKIHTPIRIVQLSDLHNRQFGEDNQRLIEKVAAQEPDLIFLTGDLLNRTDEQTDIALDLVRNLSSIAPVYLSYGNHEVDYERRYDTALTPLFEEAGAVVLNGTYVDIELNGQSLRIGGVYGYCLPEALMRQENINPEVCDFLLDVQATDAFKLLLCHMPYGWSTHGALDAWDVDCVLAGHAHGGQIRIPWIGGLYAPDQGWFPGRVWGSYTSADGQRTLVLSRGLGTSTWAPRLNNVPEIVVVDLLPEDVNS